MKKLRKYKNIKVLLKDVETLKNTLIFVTSQVDENVARLNSYEYKALKKNLERNNIKVLVLKEKMPERTI